MAANRINIDLGLRVNMIFLSFDIGCLGSGIGVAASSGKHLQQA
jgi:hypothetical protein